MSEEAQADYPGNSFKPTVESRIADAIEPEEGKGKEEVKKVISGRVLEKKTPWYKKVSSAFTGDDAKSIGQYVIFDVAIPAIRDLAFDMIKEGAQRAFYPTNGGSYQPSRGYAGRTNYGGYSANGTRDYTPGGVNNGPTKVRVQNAHSFTDIFLESRGDAEIVLKEMADAIVNYGEVTVADFLKLVGRKADFTDDGYGWTDLRQLGNPKHTRNGWQIILDRPEQLVG